QRAEEQQEEHREQQGEEQRGAVADKAEKHGPREATERSTAHARYSRPVSCRKTSSRVAPCTRRPAIPFRPASSASIHAGSRVANVSETPSLLPPTSLALVPELPAGALSANAASCPAAAASSSPDWMLIRVGLSSPRMREAGGPSSSILP